MAPNLSSTDYSTSVSGFQGTTPAAVPTPVQHLNVLNPKANFATYDSTDNPLGLFMFLLGIFLFLAIVTGVIIWRMYVRICAPLGPVRTIQSRARGRTRARGGRNRVAPKEVFLPSLHHPIRHSTSTASSCSSWIDPKASLENIHPSPPQTKPSFFGRIRSFFGNNTNKDSSLETVDSDTPNTDKEGEFVLVEAPISGGDVPSIIVSTCSPILGPQELPTSPSSDSLQVPSNRFKAPRPPPPSHLARREITYDALPLEGVPLDAYFNSMRHTFRRPFSEMRSNSNEFNGHHDFRVDAISALGFRTDEFSCSSPPRCSRASSSDDKENTPTAPLRPHPRASSEDPLAKTIESSSPSKSQVALAKRGHLKTLSQNNDQSDADTSSDALVGLVSVILYSSQSVPTTP
ncbi:hypothetical protein NLI96_g4934 [Meripilus lineatus]|uniref:Uncharacterized protein n=1 Tax=Meripilus lineatus TaxID=2056292 RepID=A0AAD5V623_9APHY|nr:hypothetical protein NLI96_g4934 [Physisporinus lineatus]